MDPLSEVLSLLKPRSYISGGFDAGGKWAIQFPPHQGIKCYAVVAGQCWLAVEGVADPVRLKAGDCFLLSSGRPFRLASDLALTPVDARAVFSAAQGGCIASCNGGGDFFLVGGHFTLDGHHAGILLGEMPPIAHIRRETDQAALRWSLERMGQELRERRPGWLLIAEHLAHAMLVQALRQHLAEAPAGGVGWLFALADKQMSAAIHAIHHDPAQRWTIQKLAEHAGMSRSSFALKFKETVGVAPMEYLTRWRMLLAGDRLANSGQPISVIAPALGYESESAFSTAFKRVMGCSPRQYSRARGRQSGAAAAEAPAFSPPPAPPQPLVFNS
ncbi:AraC family transcriptional regulator [Chromobacterium sphagni]|uniref:AraC family transcriptional regulator n=1 Tax=Chromobacterium sphagni TaxID=1903179 RepID=A0A1S1X5L7_9NEIS|nr:AraC family transcriptional regulator [Chromobacterium sphagni]OHX14771.1 AraC family transcriptional regulator [Chromobacterium sphagni]